MDAIILLALVAVALLIIAVVSSNKTKGAPPGPFKLPIIGNLHMMGQPRLLPHTLAGMAKKWGDVFSLQLGSIPMVVITNPEIVRNSFSGHDHNFIPKFVSKGFYESGLGDGLVFNESRDENAVLRKICLPLVRNLPNGVPIATIVQEELAKMIKAIDGQWAADGASKKDSITISLHDYFVNFTRNVLLRIVFSVSWEFDPLLKDKDARELSELMEESLNAVSSIADFIPHLDFFSRNSRSLTKDVNDRIKEIYRKKAAERELSLPSDVGKAKDFLDVLLIAKRNNQLSESATAATVSEIFFAGTFTVADTLDWATLFLSLNQDIQDTTFQEIDSKLKGATPTMANQPELRYVDAVCKETLRLRPPAPLLLQHRSDRDCELNGFRISKGTVITVNAFGIGNSERFFDDAEKFEPARWMGNVQTYHQANPENLVTFGHGPTICLGMPIARQELFLAFTTLVQRYHFQLSSKNPNPDLRGEFGLVFSPATWYASISKRK